MSKGRNNSSNSTGKKSLRIIMFVLLLIGAAGAYIAFGPNTAIEKDEYLYIPTNSTYDDVTKLLQEKNYVSSIATFNLLAKLAKYPEKVKAGKYLITKGMSNYNMVRKLRAGSQAPVKLVINKLRTERDLIAMLDANLEPDSGKFYSLLHNPVFMDSIGASADCGICIVIPDTYEFWWNTTAEKTLKKLGQYYKEYWNESRRSKASALGLTPRQVMTVASIVEEETNHNPEKPLIASVYLNRLKLGMKLQADPTAKYAVGDFAIKRITSAITAVPSPYNTYYTTGLPPGPICTPSKKTIDAVLNTKPTDYIYFCAKEDFSGQHRFASNYADHQKNAALYQQALNAQGIH